MPLQGSYGIAVIDPAARATLAAPPVVVEEIIADGRHFQGDRLTIPPGNDNLSIRYAALSFIGPDRIRFRYRLDGIDQAWVDAGNRRTAFYTKLPPGSYSFRVIAANAEGKWNEVGATVDFRIQPFFYQTLWFRGLALLSVLGILALIFHWRHAELHARVTQHRDAELQYREAFEKTSDAILLTDLRGKITNMNQTAERLTGYSVAAANGRDLNELLIEPDEAAQQAGSEQPSLFLSATGIRIPVEVTSHVVDYGAGPVAIQVVARDLRERQLLEQQVRQAQKMEAVGHLASGVAHDFNNLLTVIRGNSELLLENSVYQNNRGDVEQIVEAADRAAKLTQQLLTFGQKEVVQAGSNDVNEIVTGMLPMLRRLIREDVTITTSIDSVPAIVYADRGHIEQVLMNLTLNARDAMPHGGRMTIETSVDEALNLTSRSWVTLKVKDTGVGMTEEVQRQIFDPFFTTKEQGKGTGLGLSTVYGIVTHSGGTIRCISSPGEGTTFIVSLPHHASDMHVAKPLEKQTPTPSVIGNTATILLAEDEEAVRGLMSRILRKQGYTLIEACDGRDALKLASEHHGPIDLLVSDMMMPELDGRGLYTALSETHPETPVLFVSGYTTDEMVRQGLLEDGEAFVAKPFAPSVLATEVRRILDRTRPRKSA